MRRVRGTVYGAAGKARTTTRRAVSTAQQVTGALGLAASIRINAGDLKQTLDNLKELVMQQAQPLSGALQERLWDLRDQLMRLRQAAEAGAPEIRQAYQQAVSTLRSAAAQGKEQARELLNRLGESLREEFAADMEE
jgi:DNA uptake protein ComE-like DNA-binding protein